MSGDGRLDLDELGDVIDHAAALEGDARAEVLDDGRGRSWGERLEEAGVTPWLRRHRVAVAVVGAVAVLAAAGTVAVRTLVPPPVDPELRVSVTPVIPSQFVLDDSVQAFDQVGIFYTQTSLRSAYALSAQDPADTARYAILGLVGPGVRASSASLLPSPSGGVENQVARSDIDVVLDCFDADTLSTDVGDYRLRVERTDDRGRTLAQALPLPSGSPDWSAFVTSTCLQTQAQFGLEAQHVVVTGGSRPHEVLAEVTVSNSMRLPTAVGVAPIYGNQAVVATMQPLQLPARGGGVLPISFEVRDCAAPAVNFVSVPTFAGFESYGGGAPGVYLSVAFPPGVVDPSSDVTGITGEVQAPLTFTRDQQAAIDAALASICTGSPTAATAVVDVGPWGLVTGQFPTGNPQTTRISVTLETTVPGAQRVALRSPALLPDESTTVRIEPASARVVDGRATMRTWLDADCQTGYVPPPTLQLEVITRRGTFPLQATVDDARLARTLATACPELPLQSLLDFGWRDPAG